MSKFYILRGALLLSAAISLTACVSDASGTAGLGGSGGSNPGTLSSLQLGATGDGGVTQAAGISSLTDPILGTTGVLGGGDGGLVGGIIPSGTLDPLSSQLAPVSDQIASALPLSTVTDALPSLGATGTGGLTSDLLGQDPLTSVVGTDGLIASVTGGGNDGTLGNVVPPDTLPTSSLTSLTSGTPLDGLTSGLTSSSDPVGTLTSLVPVSTTDPTSSLTDLSGLTNTLTTAVSSTSPTDLTNTVTSLADPSTLTNLTSQLGL